MLFQIWYSAGANDLKADASYHACLDSAGSEDAAMRCLAAVNEKIMACTTSQFAHLWEQFPHARIGQYGYEIGCLEGGCAEAAGAFMGGAYCNAEPACMIKGLQYWQSILTPRNLSRKRAIDGKRKRVCT